MATFSISLKEKNLSQSTFTKFWSKYTQTLVSHQKLWWSWTLLFLTSSKESLVKPQNLPNTTRDQPSHHVRSKLLSDFSFQVNWLNTPSLKVPRLSPSTLPPNKFSTYFNNSALFRATQSHNINLNTTTSLRQFHFFSRAIFKKIFYLFFSVYQTVILLIGVSDCQSVLGSRTDIGSLVSSTVFFSLLVILWNSARVINKLIALLYGSKLQLKTFKIVQILIKPHFYRFRPKKLFGLGFRPDQFFWSGPD